MLASCVALGIWVAGEAEQLFGAKDAAPIVIDEIAGMLLTYCAVPVAWLPLVVGFLGFRFFDICKPLPQFERLPGGWGIMLDDLSLDSWPRSVSVSHSSSWAIEPPMPWCNDATCLYGHYTAHDSATDHGRSTSGLPTPLSSLALGHTRPHTSDVEISRERAGRVRALSAPGHGTGGPGSNSFSFTCQGAEMLSSSGSSTRAVGWS